MQLLVYSLLTRSLAAGGPPREVRFEQDAELASMPRDQAGSGLRQGDQPGWCLVTELVTLITKRRKRVYTKEHVLCCERAWRALVGDGCTPGRGQPAEVPLLHTHWRR